MVKRVAEKPNYAAGAQVNGVEIITDRTRVPAMSTTARDALASITNGDVIYNTTVGRQQEYQNGEWITLPLPKISGMTVIGHSFNVGTDSVDDQVGIVHGARSNLVATLAGLLGISNENIDHRAISGSALTQPTTAFGAAHAGWAGVLQFVNPDNCTTIRGSGSVSAQELRAVQGLGLINHGINDLLLDYAEYNFLATNGRTAWKHAMRAVISRLRAGALYSSYSKGTISWDSIFSFSGGSDLTSQFPSCTGAGLKSFSANGNSVTVTLPANLQPCVGVMCFIAQTNGMCSLTAGVDSSVTTIPISANTIMPASGTYVLKVDSEEMLVTAGAGTTSLTVTRGVNGTAAASHLINAVVTVATDAHRVDWTTSGSNAGITGSTYVSGQGWDGLEVPTVKRFILTAADAGKTIVATVAGIVSGDTSARVKFDSFWLEAPEPPPVIVVNVPRHVGFSTTGYTQVASLNADTITVVGEFDSSVAIADVDTDIYNRSGTANGATGTSGTIAFTANSKTTFDTLMNASPFRPFRMNVTSAESVLVTGIAYVSGNNYTLTVTRAITGSATNAATASAISYAAYHSIDNVHASNFGASYWARKILAALGSMTLTASQESLAAGNWTQDYRVPYLTPRDNGYLVPEMIAAATATAVVIERVTYVPVYVPKECTVTEIGCRVTTFNAGSTIALGIYGTDYMGQRPGNLLADCGTVAGSTPSGNKSITGLAIRLRPGWYWLAFLQTGTAASIATIPAGGLGVRIPKAAAPGADTMHTEQLIGYISNASKTVLPVSGANGTLNEVVGTASTSNTVVPVWIRVRNAVYS